MHTAISALTSTRPTMEILNLNLINLRVVYSDEHNCFMIKNAVSQSSLFQESSFFNNVFII